MIFLYATGEAEEFGKLLQKTRLELETHRKEAKETIARLEARCEEFESKESRDIGDHGRPTESSIDTVSREMYDNEVAVRRKAETEALMMNQKVAEKEEEIATLKQKSRETEEALSARLESAMSECERITRERDTQRTIKNERFVALERSFEDLRGNFASLQQERDALRLQVTELEGELKEAFDGLQFHLTNEISEQATKMAADALRQQVEDLRQKVEKEGTAFQAERTARLAAEQETKRLRSDLAAIFGMEPSDENQNEILRRTAEATERFQRSEKTEIDEIKNAVQRAVEELDSTRTVLAGTEQRASAAELRSVQLEQDLLTSKSDLELLSQMMEELKTAESSKRVSMENRISAFEDEQNVLRRLHEAEVENLRNELEHVRLEKEGLFQSLKDSEKSREALLQASSRSRDLDSAQNAALELARLRMEKAHLLAASSQEASRTERRIRELREAAKSAAEADVLVERELRAAAELALERATADLRNARSRSTTTDAATSQRGSNMNVLEVELKKLKDILSLLEEEKKGLQQELDLMKQSSEQKIVNLKEEVRSAKAKALQSERAVRRDAEVQAELAKLHKDSDGLSVCTQVDEGDDQLHHSSRLSSLYDLVEQQRDTIKQQRDAHSALESDFEGLLALLAQNKLVEESLSAALIEAGGEKAVTDAISNAEEKAVAQYGTFVRVGC